MKHYVLLLFLFSFSFSIFSQQSTTPDLYVVKQNNKYGYIDSTGKIMIQPQFDFADDFVGDKARILINGETPVFCVTNKNYTEYKGEGTESHRE